MRAILISLFFCVLSLSSWAQNSAFQNPDFNNELAQPYIYTSCPDDRGYLWFGTSDGLYQFNGKDLSRVELKKGIPVFVTQIISSQDTLWVGTNAGELFHIDLKDQKVDQLDWESRSKITGLIHWNEAVYYSNQSEVFKEGKSILQLGRDTLIQGIYGENQVLFVQTNRGLIEYKNGRHNLTLRSDIRVLVPIKDVLFSITSNTYAIQSGSGSWQQIPFPGEVQPEEIRSAYQSRNLLWVGAKNGLFSYRIRKSDLYFNSYFNEHTGLGRAPIISMCEAGEQIWLGTYGEGMSFFNPDNFFTAYSFPQIAPVNALLELKNDGLLVSGNSGLLYYPVFFPWHRTQKLEPQFIPSPSPVTGMIALSDREILLSTENNGLFRINLKTSKSLTPVRYEGINQEVASSGILDIQISPEGELWVSTRVYGVFIYGKNRKLITQLNVTNGLLRNNNPFSFSEKGVWFYPKSAGLTYLDNQFQKMSYFSYNEGIKNLEFTSALPSNNEIWLGTEGGGICIGENEQFRHITTADGLSSNYIIGLARKGGLKVALSPKTLTLISPRLIHSISPRQIGFDVFFSPQSVIHYGNNYWIYGTDQGIITHHYKVPDNPTTGNVVIKRIILNGSDSLFASGKSLILEPGDYQIDIELDRISPNPFDEIPLSYRLTGHNKQLELLPANNTLRFPSIRDGEYQLEVYDQFGKQLLRYPFEITPPIWKTIWFWLLVALCLGLGIYFYTLWRLKNLRLKNILLEKKVAERTYLLKLRNRDLEQFTYTLSHDLKNPAVNMIQLTDLLKSELANTSMGESELVEMLEESAKGMHEKLLGFLEVLKNSRGSSAQLNDIKVHEVLQGLMREFKPSLAACSGKIISGVPDIIVHFNKDRFTSILHNLLSNAIKYRDQSKPLEIHVRYKNEGKFHVFEVEDNGLGIDMETQGEKLFGMFKRIHDHVEGTGVGLNLVKSILENSGGWIEVESEQGNGSIFSFGIPKKPKLFQHS